MILQQRIRFYQQLAVLARAGVPMRTNLQRLEGKISGPEIHVLSERIAAGDRLGDAFFAARFSPFECHLVAAGERGARLETVFQHLADFWARQQQMHQAIVGQLYYPVIVLHLSLLVGTIIEATINSSWLIAIIHLIVYLAFLYTIAFALYTLVKASWNSDAAQSFWLGLPIIGRALSTAYAYRWITALKLEFVAGIPMPDAVADAWRASGWAGSESLAAEGHRELMAGADLSTLVRHWKRLPRDWIDFIETGEISGALETAFDNLEAEASRSWETAQQRMTAVVPKVLYFMVLILAAIQIGSILYQVTAGPINEINKEIDNALHH